MVLCVPQQVIPSDFELDLYDDLFDEDSEVALGIGISAALTAGNLVMIGVNAAYAPSEAPSKPWAIVGLVSSLVSMLAAVPMFIEAGDFRPENEEKVTIAAGVLLGGAGVAGTLSIVNLARAPKSRPYWALAPSVSEDGGNVSLAVRF